MYRITHKEKLGGNDPYYTFTLKFVDNYADEKHTKVKIPVSLFTNNIELRERYIQLLYDMKKVDYCVLLDTDSSTINNIVNNNDIKMFCENIDDSEVSDENYDLSFEWENNNYYYHKFDGFDVTYTDEYNTTHEMEIINVQ